MDIAADIFNHKLGSPIWVGGAKGEFLGAWHFLGPPIDSCG